MPDHNKELPGLPLPSPCPGPRPHIHLRLSIVAPASSSNALRQAEQPWGQSEQEALGQPHAAKAAPGCFGALRGKGADNAIPALLLGNFPNMKKSQMLLCWQASTTGYTYTGY